MLEFTTTFRTSGQPEPKPADETPKYTILLTGPFAGDSPTPFTDPVTVDVDSFHAVMARTAPSATIAGQHLAFLKPADFDPLMVAQASAPASRWFAWLSAVRTGGPDCAEGRQAREALKAGQPGGPPAATAQPTPAAGKSSFEELLSGSSTVSSEPTRLPGNSIVDRLIAQTVSGTTGPSQEETDALLGAIAARLGGQLREVFHDPAFRELETTWLSLDEMIGDFDTDDPVRFLFLPFNREDWTSLMQDAERAAVWRARLAETCPAQPDLIATTAQIDPGPEAAAAMASLLALADVFGCQVLANADFASLLKHPPSGPVTKSDLVEQCPFPQLAGSVARPRLRLATPRFRMRLPYGEDSNPAGSFVFEEYLPDDPPSRLPWAPSSLLCARAWASKYREEEEDTNWSQVTQIAGFPPLASGAKTLAATEHVLTETAMAHLYTLGCLPLTAMRNSDRILVGA